MICGAKWKTCDCPWFNYTAIEADRLNHMNIPQIRAEIARGNPAIHQPRAYHEELERRREQEQQDEELARRMQRLDFELGRNYRNELPVFGVGNAGGHFLNDDFIQRATNILTGAWNPGYQAAADRLVAEIRGNQRVDTHATGIDIPTPNPPFAPPHPHNQQQAQTPATRISRPGSRRSATMRRPTMPTRPSLGQEDPFVDAAPEELTNSERRRRSAVLAGLTRPSMTGRVDAWRHHISGDDGSVSPVA